MKYSIEWYCYSLLLERAVVSYFHLLRLLRAEGMKEADFTLWESHYNKGEVMTLRSSDGYFMTIRKLEE